MVVLFTLNMNKEISSINEQIYKSIKLARKLKIDKNQKRQLLNDLRLSNINLKQIEKVLSFWETLTQLNIHNTTKLMMLILFIGQKTTY